MGDDNNLEPTATDGAGTPSTEPNLPGVPAKELTPGQRLAAKKAQKAETKRDFKDELKRKAEAEREKEAAEVEQVFGRGPVTSAAPDTVQRAAVEFSSYLQGHRLALVGAVIGVVAIGVAWIYGKKALSAGSVEQTNLLTAAAEIENGGIDPTDDDGKAEDGKPTFKTVEARDRAALDAYVNAESEDPKSVAAGWAKLAEAAIAVQLGRFDDAAKSFEAVYSSHKVDTAIAARALEGLGIALEASGKADEAQKRFDELKTTDTGFGADLSAYHSARLKLAKGDRDGAKDTLKGVYDHLVEASAKGDRNRYLKGEVEVRLAELDSSLVPNMMGAEEPGQFTPEQIQRLIEQMQKKGGAQGGAGAE